MIHVSIINCHEFLTMLENIIIGQSLIINDQRLFTSLQRAGVAFHIRSVDHIRISNSKRRLADYFAKLWRVVIVTETLTRTLQGSERSQTNSWHNKSQGNCAANFCFCHMGKSPSNIVVIITRNHIEYVPKQRLF